MTGDSVRKQRRAGELSRRRRARAVTRVACERLEERKLLAAVSGTVWNDVNLDGVQNAGEVGVSGRSVYLDQNNNGVLDPGEVTTSTGVSGGYSFVGINTGTTCYVRLVQQAGWSQTFPASAGANVAIANATGVNLGVVNQSTVVSGTVWNDRNGSGVQDAVEPSLSGRTVYVDYNSNGVLDAGEPNATSSATGAWSIADVLPGSRTIRLESTGDQTVTFPTSAGGGSTVNVLAGRTTTNVAFGQAFTYQTGFSAFQRLPSPASTSTSSAWSGSIAISGNFAVVGAPTYVVSGSGPVGRADILSNAGTGGTWVQVKNLSPGSLPSNAGYGKSVSIDGTWAAVTAVKDSNGFGNTGAVYLYRLSGGVWSQVQRLTPFSSSQTQFGLTAVLRGTELFVGVADITGTGQLFQYRLSSDGLTWTYYGQLQASDPTSNQRFGSDNNISISGSTMVVGATGGSGAAYVFVRGSSGNWSFAQKITASTPEAGSNFGGAVSVEGDRMAIGASLSTDPSGSGGKVYLYKRDSAGVWQPDTSLTVSDTGTGNQFGASVRLSGGSLFVGAPRADTLATDAGRIYVYRQTPQGTWSQYVASNESSVFDNSLFGSSLASRSDLLLVGAPLSGGSGNPIGAVSFYSLQNTLAGYIQGTVFTDSNRNGVLDAGETPLSGRVVYLDTNLNGVIDAFEPASVTDASGRYSFGPVSSGGPYTVRTTIDSSSESQTTPGGNLAYSVTLGAGQTFVGDFGLVKQSTTVSGLVWNDRNVNGSQDAGEPAVSDQTVYVDLNGNGFFDAGEPSTTTAANGSWTITGAPTGLRTVRIAADSKYMAVGSGAWTGTLTAGVATSGLNFGLAVKAVTGFTGGQLIIAGTGVGNTQVTDVSISGDNAILGAANFGTGGAAFVYRRGADGTWNIVQTLQPAFLSTTSRMGSKVSIDGDWAAVSAPTFYGTAPDTTTARYGTVLLYRRQVDGTWSLAQTISSPAAAFNGYGQSILLKGGELLIQSSNGFLDYQLNANGTWTSTGSIAVIASGTDPKPISMSGGVLVVGTPGDSDQAASVYSRNASGTWSLQQRLVTPVLGQQFGSSVATDGQRIAVGAPRTGAYSEGQVYTYSMSGGVWRLDAKLTIPGGTLNAGFGFHVRLQNNALYVAAPFAQLSAGYGAIYAYVSGFGSSGWLLESVLDASRSPTGSLLAVAALVSNTDILLTTSDPAPGNATVYSQVVQPASYLNGTVFNDVNRNGAQDAGEAGLSGWTVYIDQDNNGRLDTGEPSTVTDSSGAYAFDDLVPATDYVLRIVQQAGKSQVYPVAGNGFVVSNLASGSVVSRSFGVINGGTTVTGIVWNDRNANGVFDANESVLGGPIIYWDGNNNGTLDIGEISTTAAADGTWTLRDVPPGQQVFRVSTSSGYIATTSGVSVTVLPATTRSGVNLGVALEVTGSATLTQVSTSADFVERFGERVAINGNYAFVSAPDTGAFGPLLGRTYVYTKSTGGNWIQTQTLDLSADTSLDYVSGLGSAIASDGNWAAVGTYYYDQVASAGSQVQGAILLFTNQPFTQWTHRQTLTGGGPAFVPGRLESVLISGSLLFAHVSSSTQSSIETFRLGSNGVWTWASEVVLSPTLNFGSGSFTTMSLSGNTLVVSNKGAGQDLAKVFSVDTNGNLSLATNLSAPPVSLAFPYSLASSYQSSVSIEDNTIVISVVPDIGTDSAALYTYNRQDNGTWVAKSMIIYGGVTNDGFGTDVVLAGGKLYVGVPDKLSGGGANSGLVRLYSGDGQGGWNPATELFPDGSGSVTTWANFGASIAVSGSDFLVGAPGSPSSPYTVGGSAYFYQRPATAAAYIQGTAFEDTNGNGVRDAGEDPLVGWTVYLDLNGDNYPDSDEPQAVTDESGAYRFNNLVAGTYTVRIESRPLWTQTTPVGGGAYPVTLAPGDTFSGDFGLRRTSTVVGSVFADANNDGVFQVDAELGLVNWVVFADLNNNGVPDAGDPIAVTAGSGVYQLSDLPSGQITIAVVNGAAWGLTPKVVTVPPFFGVGGVNFGSYPAATNPPNPPSLSFGGRLIIDEDGNGLIDSDETFPVPNAQVNIYRDDGDGIFEPGGNDLLVGVASSDGAGNIAFPDAQAGSYWTEVVTTSTGTLVESPASVTVHSLFGRSNVQRVVIGAEQPSMVVDYSVLTAFTVVTNQDSGCVACQAF